MSIEHCWATGSVWERGDAGRAVWHPVLQGALLAIRSALEMLELFDLHELMSWRAAFLRVRVEKVCKVFRVCVDACPVDRALYTTAIKSRELLFRTKNMFISFPRVNFFFFRLLFLHLLSCG